MLCGTAPADARTKKSPSESAIESSLPVTAPQVRFFTINAVLAKHDGLRRSASGPVEMASTGPASPSAVASDAPALPAIPTPTDEPFGLMTFRAPEGVLWTKWRGVEAAMDVDAGSVGRCNRDDARCSPSERRFVALMRSAREAGDARTRAELVNRAVNDAVRYVTDYQQHGVADRWTSPLQTLRSGIGDCEDYAIAKYALLRAAGADEADLKLVLVRDLAVRQDHAVLAVRLDGRWLVLDNRRASLLDGRDLQSFMPLFAIDHRGVSLFAAPYAARPHHESESDMAPAADAGTAAASSALPLQL
ncbi:transglutaminase-like cysteine peptidase [Rhodopseudomonas palustris]|uniref:transglutaminase-like cysteine peptidase n=1 Tax=Rhodopseudomonas palustris TaxID=1076 RepID=UPI002ACD740C|nr:transglutaminase-like cysteine peptidase [Rhodopseudomonas palustris]WQH01344.1 transglutaminase-like cysteine peptidase [Rhodopseudomonas palustris]